MATGQRAGAATLLATRCREEEAWLVPAVLGVCKTIARLAQQADGALVRRGQEPRCQDKCATVIRKAFASVRATSSVLHNLVAFLLLGSFWPWSYWVRCCAARTCTPCHPEALCLCQRECTDIVAMYIFIVLLMLGC